jgi:hypothetical protein
VSSALFVTALLTSEFVRAQAGDGIKVAGGRLHPLVENETHYIENPAFEPPGSTHRDIFVVGRGGLELELPSQYLDLQIRSALEWHQYLGAFDEATQDFSHWGGELRFAATFNKESRFVLRLSEELVRHADPTSIAADPALPAVVEVEPRTVNIVRLGVDGKPGGGALVLTAEYATFVDWSSAGSRSLRQLPELRATWKFLPKTAITLQSTATIAQYPFGDAYPSGERNPGTSAYQTYIGLIGDLTPRTGVVLKVGHSLVIQSGQHIHDVAGQAELAYRISERHNLKLGYVRLYEPTSFYGYFAINRGYLRYEHLLFTNTQLDAELVYNDLDYGPLLTTGVAGDRALVANRRDGLFAGQISVQQNLNPWLYASISNRYERRDSNSGELRSEYRRNDAFLRIGIRY